MPLSVVLHQKGKKFSMKSLVESFVQCVARRIVNGRGCFFNSEIGQIVFEFAGFKLSASVTQHAVGEPEAREEVPEALDNGRSCHVGSAR